MIWAGMVYLQDKTNMTEEEILDLPYPKFKAMIEYHTDPETFLKGGFSQKEYDLSVKEAQQQNMNMMRKAIEKQKEMEKKKKSEP
jgi:hypothetical protein